MSSTTTLAGLDTADIAMDVRFFVDGSEVDGLQITAEVDSDVVTLTVADATSDRVFLLTVTEVSA